MKINLFFKKTSKPNFTTKTDLWSYPTPHCTLTAESRELSLLSRATQLRPGPRSQALCFQASEVFPMELALVGGRSLLNMQGCKQKFLKSLMLYLNISNSGKIMKIPCLLRSYRIWTRLSDSRLYHYSFRRANIEVPRKGEESGSWELGRWYSQNNVSGFP